MVGHKEPYQAGKRLGVFRPIPQMTVDELHVILSDGRFVTGGLGMAISFLLFQKTIQDLVRFSKFAVSVDVNVSLEIMQFTLDSTTEINETLL